MLKKCIHRKKQLSTQPLFVVYAMPIIDSLKNGVKTSSVTQYLRCLLHPKIQDYIISQGMIVLRTRDDTWEVHISQLPSGVYFVTASGAFGTMSGRFIKV